jgi:hypothetical protein
MRDLLLPFRLGRLPANGEKVRGLAKHLTRRNIVGLQAIAPDDAMQTAIQRRPPLRV